MGERIHSLKFKSTNKFLKFKLAFKIIPNFYLKRFCPHGIKNFFCNFFYNVEKSDFLKKRPNCKIIMHRV